MTHPASHAPLRITVLILALWLAALAGCAPRAATAPGAPPARRGAPLSESGKVTLAYLDFLDHFHRMQRMLASPLGQEGMEDLLAQQRRAAEALDQIIALEPHPGLYMEKASLFLLTRQQLGTAKNILKEGLEKFPRDKNLLLSLVNLYAAEQRHEAAAGVLQEYLDTEPGDQAATVFLARLQLDKNAPAQALETLARIPEDRHDLEILQLKGRALAQAGRTREASETLRRALALNPDAVDTLAELAYVQEMEKDSAGAEKTYQRMLALGDPTPEVRLRLMGLNLEMKRPDKALELALTGPKSPAFLMEAAKTFLNQKLYAQASAVLDRMDAPIQERPELLFIRSAIAFEGENNPAKALEFLVGVPESSPHHERALSFRIHLLHAMDRDDEALALMAEARTRYPRSRELALSEAGIHEDLRNLAQALALLDQALAVWPGDIEILYRKGVVLERLGQRVAALQVMEGIVAADPDNPDALNFVGYSLAEDGVDLDRALVLVTSALKQKPDSLYIVDSLAWVYHRMGRHDEAWKEIRRASAADDPVIWEHYGDIAQALGKKDEARKGWRRALKLKTEHEDRVRKKLKE